MRTLLILALMLVNVDLVRGQNRYDIIIDEIMADPTPTVGLPNNEWIELKNRSTTSINLQNWRIGDANTQSGALPSFVLQPDSFVIICSAGSLATLSVFGTAIAVSGFPSLDNEGDNIYLKASNGVTIHGIRYTVEWYQNDLKKLGGWSLEMIDTDNPCGGVNNWEASNDARGGSPGKKNSIEAINLDKSGPRLKAAYANDSVTIELLFDEPIDSLQGSNFLNYKIDGGLECVRASSLPPIFNAVQLKTNRPLAANTVYRITATNIRDCSNNIISADNTVKAGLPVDPASGDWVVNEILFNPRANAYDYVEFYNISNKVLDAARLFIANRNQNGVINSITPLSENPFYIFPGDYLVVTEDAASLGLQYHVKDPTSVLEVNSLPSYPDESGAVIGLNQQGAIIDEVNYRESWHFKLFTNTEGVSLERIDPSAKSQDESNWHSAASTAGYGTPGYKNSQFMQANVTQGIIELSPKVFSPDNDGNNDILTVQYNVSQPGWVANVTIFDACGRSIRYLIKNRLIGVTGYWNWDGLDDNGSCIPVGIYIVNSELFNLQGDKQRIIKTVVLARRLQ